MSDTVLITGGGGFIAAHLAPRLAAEGLQVHLLHGRRVPAVPDGLLPTVRLHQLARPTTSIALDRLLDSTRPGTIVHLAGHYEADTGARAIDRLADANFVFGTRLLGAMQRAGITRIVNAATFWQWRSKRDPKPVNLYAALKSSFHGLLDHYATVHGFRAASLVLPDIYGPDDPRPKLWPALVRAAQSRKPIALTSGRQRIHLVHVSDVAEAFTLGMRITGSRKPGHDLFALAPDRVRSVREIVAVAERLTAGRVRPIWGAIPASPRAVVDPFVPARPLPGWRPKISLEAGFRSLFVEHGRS